MVLQTNITRTIHHSTIPSLRRPNGFTIVELLIVIVVIALLATVVIVAYNGVQNRAKDSVAQTTVKQASTKVLTYAAANSDSFPADLATLGIGDSNNIAYQYTVTNTAPRAYCISATVSGISYFMSNTVTTPTSGTCNAPPEVLSSIFGSSYPYTATVWNDGNGSLKVATIFYSYNNSFTVKGARVHLPSVPPGVSLTIFYVRGWHASNPTFQQPDWNAITGGIPGQYVTIPNSSLTTGWNKVTFPTPTTINPYNAGVDGTAVWIGYYFSDGKTYIFTPSQGGAATSGSNPNLFLAESDFEGNKRSSNNIGGWTSALYGIDILTSGP